MTHGRLQTELQPINPRYQKHTGSHVHFAASGYIQKQSVPKEHSSYFELQEYDTQSACLLH